MARHPTPPPPSAALLKTSPPANAPALWPRNPAAPPKAPPAPTGVVPARTFRLPNRDRSALDSDALDPLHPGSVLDGHRIEHHVGAGGFADVFRVTKPLGVTLAMKVLRPELAADPEARARFRLEPRFMNAVRHPGVPRAVAEGLTPDDRPFFVMDWIDGETLAARAARLGGRLSAREVERLGRQLATRLGAIHQAGVLHLDLKPDNLFVTRAGSVMVSDFGVSRWMAEASDPPAPMGTPLFMAPEQVTGAALGPWTDVRALGATLFVLLTGRAPSPTRARRSVLGLLLAPPRPVRSLCPSAPRHLADLIDQCLSPIPARRPTTDEIRTTLRPTPSPKDTW